MKLKTRNRLTGEQRKALWANPESNAGAGWSSRQQVPFSKDDGDDYEQQQREAQRFND